MEFLCCIVYLALIGVCFFGIGRLWPKGHIRGEGFPWRACALEREGRIYEALGVKGWQRLLPDMSRVFPKLMPAKSMEGALDEARLKRMIAETCVAEGIHVLLCAAALPCLGLWPGVGGAVVFAVYVLGNLPFIIIQRYNRPRLQRLLRRMKR